MEAFKCLKAETTFTEVTGSFMTNFSKEGEGEQSLPAHIRQRAEYLHNCSSVDNSRVFFYL